MFRKLVCAAALVSVPLAAAAGCAAGPQGGCAVQARFEGEPLRLWTLLELDDLSGFNALVRSTEAPMVSGAIFGETLITIPTTRDPAHFREGLTLVIKSRAPPDSSDLPAALRAAGFVPGIRIHNVPETMSLAGYLSAEGEGVEIAIDRLVATGAGYHISGTFAAEICDDGGCFTASGSFDTPLVDRNGPSSGVLRPSGA